MILFFISLNQSFANCSASFTWWTDPFVTSPIQFSDSSSGSGTLSYYWDFGDGTSDTVQNPAHYYLVAGNFNVCLTITDSLGCTSSSCDSVILNPQGVYISKFEIDTSSLINCATPATINFTYMASVSGYDPTDSARIEVDYGDGVDSIFYVILLNPYFHGGITHIYQNSGIFHSQIIVSSSNQFTDTSTSQLIIVTTNCENISGKVFDDLNSNCVYDIGEESPNRKLQILYANQFMDWTTSDANGDYSFNVPSGMSYDIHIILDVIGDNHIPSCPPSGIITANAPSSGNDIGIICPAGFDLQGQVSSGMICPGRRGYVSIDVFNPRCNSPNGQIDIILPAELTPLPDSTVIFTINGQTVSCPIYNNNFEWYYNIYVDVSSSLQIGDSVCIDVILQPIVGDFDSTNNRIRYCSVIDTNCQLIPVQEINSNSLIIYPNPADDLCNIKFKNSGKKIVTLMNALGKIVWKISSTEESILFNTEGLANGIYFLRIESKETIINSFRIAVFH